MRVLFIDPPGNLKPKEGKPGGGLSLGIATLASVLMQHGHQVSLYDMANHYENRTIDSIRNSLDLFKPDLIGVTILNAQYLFAIEIVKKLREQTDVPIIVGGAEVTALNEKIFTDMNFAIDVSVLGEGEETLLEILETYKNNSSSTLIDKLRKINGIIINNNRKLIRTGDVQLVSNLDDYPPPDFSIFGVKRWRMYRLQGSRGCPFNCSFCYQYLGHSWRKRSPKIIVDDLLGAYKKYNYTYIRFLDPVFNFRIEWVHELCDELIESGLSDIPWEAQGVRYVVPLSYLKDFKDIQLCGFTFNVPVASEAYMKYRYGINWKIPSKNWRFADGEYLRFRRMCQLPQNKIKRVKVYADLSWPKNRSKPISGTYLFSKEEIVKIKSLK